MVLSSSLRSEIGTESPNAVNTVLKLSQQVPWYSFMYIHRTGKFTKYAGQIFCYLSIAERTSWLATSRLLLTHGGYMCHETMTWS